MCGEIGETVFIPQKEDGIRRVREDHHTVTQRQELYLCHFHIPNTYKYIIVLHANQCVRKEGRQNKQGNLELGWDHAIEAKCHR
jgi:hypothetical protein